MILYLRLPHAQRRMNFVFVIVDKFSNINFISCKETNDVFVIAWFIFEDVIYLYGASKTITLDKDNKFLSHFLQML